MFQNDVASVTPLPDRALALTFEDGVRATLSLDKIVKSYEGIFAPLLDDAFFRQVRVDQELGTVIWPNGADICPDVLYSFALGRPLLISNAISKI